LLPAGAFAGWDLHPLESAALSRRTPKADILIGDGGRDVIWGLGGNDILYGKGGKDMLVGFAGRDTFVFDTKPGKASMDTISDFSTKYDSIWLDNKVFKKLGRAGTKDKPAALKKGYFVGPEQPTTC
ncbi:hypothetical protein AAII07_49760, partial [Microvirga sp. 0TCS3.31]